MVCLTAFAPLVIKRLGQRFVVVSLLLWLTPVVTVYSATGMDMPGMEMPKPAGTDSQAGHNHTGHRE